MDSQGSHSLGPAVVAVAWTFASLAILVVGARLYARLRIVRRLSIDDCIILFTLCLGLGNSIFLTISTSWGLGQHLSVLQADPERVMYTVKWVYLCEFFSILCPCFGRISFALLLLGIIPPTSTSRRTFLKCIIVVQLVVDVGTVIISFSQCQPLEGFWNKSIASTCWPPFVQQYTGFTQGSVCSLIDLILALFPASMFWSLKMQWKQKVALSSLMGLGVFAMIASIVKTVGLRAITATDDLTYEMANLAIWWTLEANLVLIAASVPTLRPIFKVKRGQIRDGGSAGTGLGTWNRSQRIKMSTNDDSGPFVALSEPESRDEADIGVQLKSYDNHGYQANAIAGQKAQDHVGDGIRRDFTVTVVYGKQDS
ncbi:hypothetical protein N656DRAFT_784967 [Canariomyces notabilis]|uniref:Rhodopsin domain-containing protein n=1 Tax=Canariomyces notabilis TaxID=2074819 RepID=A0AAN6T7N1_9PEZI|nr:hypothetical protein N656DRAFT_784967 [Canariomyces arenarius]